MARCSRCGNYQNMILSTFGYCDDCEAELGKPEAIRVGDRVVIHCPQPALDGKRGEVKGVNAKVVRVLLDSDSYGLSPFPHEYVEKLPS